MVAVISKSSCHGIGAFGEVRMCVHRETGAQRAVKVLRKSHMDDDEKKMLFNEINILKQLVSIGCAFLFLFYLIIIQSERRIFLNVFFKYLPFTFRIIQTL